MTKQTLEEYRKEMLKEGTARGHNAHIGLWMEDGTSKTHGSGPCHGSLSTLGSRRAVPKAAKYVISSQVTLVCAKKWARYAEGFYHYLFNDSPWAPVFVTKNWTEAKELGILVDAKQDERLVIGGLIASRFFTERYDNSIKERIPVYATLVDAGVSHHEAFMYSMCLASRGKNGSVYPFVFNPLHAAHAPLYFGDVGATYFKNFLEMKPQLGGKSLAENGGYSRGVFRTWGTLEKEKVLMPLFKVLRPRESQTLKDLHIFRPKPKEGVAISNEMQLLDILQQARELIYA